MIYIGLVGDRKYKIIGKHSETFTGKIFDIIKSVTTEKEVNELYKSNISKIIIQPLINKFLEESMVYLNKISVEDIYNQYKQKNKDNSNKKVDFVI